MAPNPGRLRSEAEELIENIRRSRAEAKKRGMKAWTEAESGGQRKQGEQGLSELIGKGGGGRGQTSGYRPVKTSAGGAEEMDFDMAFGKYIGGKGRRLSKDFCLESSELDGDGGLECMDLSGEECRDGSNNSEGGYGEHGKRAGALTDCKTQHTVQGCGQSEGDMTVESEGQVLPLFMKGRCLNGCSLPMTPVLGSLDLNDSAFLFLQNPDQSKHYQNTIQSLAIGEYRGQESVNLHTCAVDPMKAQTQGKNITESLEILRKGNSFK